MMHADWLNVLLRTGIFNSSDMFFDPLMHRDNLRGGNTVCWWADANRYICDSNANCPRIAVLRRRGIEERPSLESILSWTYGRAFETLVKQLIDRANNPDVTYTSEEDALVEWVDDQGKTIFTARSDILIKYQSRVHIPVEIKTAQSDNVSVQVFHKLQPKLGALLQLGVSMDYFDAELGFLLYGSMHWTNAYDRATRSQIRLQPNFNSMTCTLDDDRRLLINNRPTIVTIDSIEDGINMLVAYDREGKLPGARPLFCDIYGNRFNYDYCKMYCPFGGVCDSFQHYPEIPIDDFIEQVKMEVDIK